MLGGQLGQHERGDRRGVGRLEHHGVAGGQGGGDLPDGHHQRVVPRGHLGAHPDRLAPDPGGVAGQVLARRAALEDPGRAGEEPDLVEDGGISSLRVRASGLPVLRPSATMNSSARASSPSARREQQPGCAPRAWRHANARRRRPRPGRPGRRPRALRAAPRRRTSPCSGRRPASTCRLSASTHSPLTKLRNWVACPATRGVPSLIALPTFAEVSEIIAPSRPHCQ